MNIKIEQPKSATKLNFTNLADEEDYDTDPEIDAYENELYQEDESDENHYFFVSNRHFITG